MKLAGRKPLIRRYNGKWAAYGQVSVTDDNLWNLAVMFCTVMNRWEIKR
jgi:hypothetical protein